MKLVYVASPYTHKVREVRWLRFFAVQKYMAITAFHPTIIRFSPIVANHELAEKFNLKGDAESWKRYNRTFFERCDEMEILMIDGWEESDGVAMETDWAKELNIPVTHVKPPEL